MTLMERRRAMMGALGEKNPLTLIGSVELSEPARSLEFLVPEEHQNDKMFLVDATLVIPNARSIYPCLQLNDSTKQSYMGNIKSGMTIKNVFYVVPAPISTTLKMFVASLSSSTTNQENSSSPIQKIRFQQFYNDAIFGAGSKLTVYSADLERYLPGSDAI